MILMPAALITLQIISDLNKEYVASVNKARAAAANNWNTQSSHSSRVSNLEYEIVNISVFRSFDKC